MYLEDIKNTLNYIIKPPFKINEYNSEIHETKK